MRWIKFTPSLHAVLLEVRLQVLTKRLTGFKACLQCCEPLHIHVIEFPLQPEHGRHLVSIMKLLASVGVGRLVWIVARPADAGLLNCILNSVGAASSFERRSCCRGRD